MFRGKIAVYCDNHTKPVNTLCGQSAELLIVKVGGKYSYHWALKGTDHGLFMEILASLCMNLENIDPDLYLFGDDQSTVVFADVQI
jgi:hypothetical protein